MSAPYFFEEKVSFEQKPLYTVYSVKGLDKKINEKEKLEIYC